MINTAASAYIWENVAKYDYTFRQLMSTYPQRSWAKIYNQMWNISMREPVTKFNQNYAVKSGGQSFHGNNSGTSGSANNNKLMVASSNPSQKCPNYCWTFNKGNCKDGQKCQFVNRCSYCDSASHGIISCPRAKKAGVTIISQSK